MRRTHLSLYYLAGYVLPAAVALLLIPQTAVTLLFSNGEYPDIILQMVGVPLFGLGVVVVQIIRHRLIILYPTTLFIRAFICISFAFLYAFSSDPMFLVLIGVVGFGFVLTGTAYWMDRRERISSKTS